VGEYINGIWYDWIMSSGTASATTICTNADATWTTWNTTSSATIIDPTWYTWTSDGTSTSSSGALNITGSTWTAWIGAGNYGSVVSDGYHPTPEQQATWEREQAKLQANADKAQAERVEAVMKAKALLASMLDEQQRQQLERDRFFDFVSQTGKKMRMKSFSCSRNVDELGEDGKRIKTFCAHPGQYDLPVEDHMVAQLLALQHNEEAFMRVANMS
jgi:hypothetical protein